MLCYILDTSASAGFTSLWAFGQNRAPGPFDTLGSYLPECMVYVSCCF